ncbi:LOW QUALITY PROTEIN: hypothetical protein RJ640_018242 [Escallonia rubra]|uniref:Uncharacterized protein n=1 Tax=Escallonia rubra TaxID=112253 RepID=A0AA88QD60_9ASTE|nr:LOW QUALITY PROTEIN: hypothetical protein RJ640_018242 [Escallonia rubra]
MLPNGSYLLQNKKQKASGPLDKAFNVVERNIADKIAARLFYASALCPYFRKHSQTLANSNIGV